MLSPCISPLPAATPQPYFADGIRAIGKQEEPIGRHISKMEIAEGLVLEKVAGGRGLLLMPALPLSSLMSVMVTTVVVLVLLLSIQAVMHSHFCASAHLVVVGHDLPTHTPLVPHLVNSSSHAWTGGAQPARVSPHVPPPPPLAGHLTHWCAACDFRGTPRCPPPDCFPGDPIRERAAPQGDSTLSSQCDTYTVCVCTFGVQLGEVVGG